jgi:hypothetical protein
MTGKRGMAWVCRPESRRIQASRAAAFDLLEARSLLLARLRDIRDEPGCGERQQVRLPGDLVDDADDVADAARIRDARHRLHRLRDHLSAPRYGQRTRSRAVRTPGIRVHGLGHLGHRRCGLLQRGGVALGAAGKIVGAGGNLLGGIEHLVRAPADPADHAAHRVEHLVHQPHPRRDAELRPPGFAQAPVLQLWTVGFPG